MRNGPCRGAVEMRQAIVRENQIARPGDERLLKCLPRFDIPDLTQHPGFAECDRSELAIVGIVFNVQNPERVPGEIGIRNRHAGSSWL